MTLSPLFRSLKRLSAAVIAVLAVAFWLASPTAWGQDINYFRIGTGSPSGTYFPVGETLAAVISSPPGSPACDDGGRCGVPGMIAVAQATGGSVANLEAVAAGRMDSGLAQADVVHAAFYGEWLFRDRNNLSQLRAIANLYPESVHLVAAKHSGIRSVTDLKGKRVSIDVAISGTQVDALMILKAFGLGRDSIRAVEVGPGEAADMLLKGDLDAYFFVAGFPAAGVADLAAQDAVHLVPIAGPPADRLRREFAFFTAGTIPEGVYQDQDEVETLMVGAQWVVSAAAAEQLVYQITRALWHPTTREVLDNGHERARQIMLETALLGVSIPLHAGALRYYLEAGVLD